MLLLPFLIYFSCGTVINTLPKEPFFGYSILPFFRKTLHESNKIFVEHALHIARIQL